MWDYWDAIHLAIRMSECKIDPIAICCDFEKALMNAARQQFSKVSIAGCSFHFKQALRRHMISKLKMKEEQASAAMAKNVLDILTIIPRGEIATKGVPCAKEHLDSLIISEEDKSAWGKFWEYFLFFWCSSEEFIAAWNANDGGNFCNMHDRANNGIERQMCALFTINFECH